MQAEEKEPSELLDLALADPAEAVVAASQVLAAGPDAAARVVLLRARGLARRLLGQREESMEDLTEALASAERIDNRELWAGVGITMAGNLVYQGRIDAAKELLEECLAASSGVVRAEALFQLGSTHLQAGELDVALRIYKDALPQIRRHKRRDWESQLVGNRGIVHIFAGDYAEAIQDLDRAIELQLELDIPAQAALNMHNKAQALYLSGELAASLDLYATAEQHQSELGMPVLMHAQKCDAFLAAGMFEATLDLAQQATRFHKTSGGSFGEILSFMPGAEAAIALREFDLAKRLATAATNVEGAASFPVWIRRAELAKLEANALSGEIDNTAAATAAEISAASLKSDPVTATRGLLLASRISSDLGEDARANDLLNQVKSLARRSPLHLQIERWRLVAGLRSRSGNRYGTLRAVDAGMRAFTTLTAGVSAYDVRARATRYAESLVEVGVRELIAAERFSQGEQLIEQLRGGALQVRLDASSTQARALIKAETDLRRGEVAASGSRVLSLQHSVAQDQSPREDSRDLSADETRLTFIDVDDNVVCIVASTAGSSLRNCGPTKLIAERARTQAFVHRQLARRSRLTKGARDALAADAINADRALAEALLPTLTSERVIINPSSATRGVSWGALPGLFERPHTIAASMSIARRRLPGSTRSATVVGSSELDHVGPELHAIARCYSSLPTIDPSADVLQSLNAKPVLHAAGHFTHSGSNPLFSGVELGDWNLRGTDMLRLTQPPAIVVLSACTSGSTDVIGGAPVGFTTAALAAGTAAVIATQSPVEDGEAIVDTMTRLHRLLCSGTPPADALVVVRAESAEHRHVAASMLTVGTGW